MRMIHIVPAISNEASGPSYSVVRLCESLIAQGAAVTLAVLDWASMPSPPPFVESFPLGLGPRRLGRSPGMQRWLKARAESHSIDLIHNHSLWMMPNLYAGQVAARYDIPLMVSPRGTLSEWAKESGSAAKRVFWPLMQRPALSPTTCFHATAGSEYEDIRRLGFLQPVAVIPNGVDIPNVPRKVPRRSRTLLFLGRIHEKKGLDVLLPAWRAVQDRFPEWRLRIVGPDDGYLSKMQRLGRELRLERLEFSGVLLGAQKWQAYEQAELFVLPTHSENFGMAVAEALAAGTPAIVSKGAPWGGLEGHGAGWWIDIGIDPLVACLETALAQSPSGLAEMGLRGRDWVSAEYSWTRVAHRMADTYLWMLERGNKPEWVIKD